MAEEMAPGEPIVTERVMTMPPPPAKAESKLLLAAGGEGKIIPLTEVKPLTEADVRTKNEVLKTYVDTRDRAEENIERLKGDLGDRRLVGIVITLKRFMPMVQRIIEKVEWNGDFTSFSCPMCNRERVHGHEKDCLIAAVKREMGMK